MANIAIIYFSDTGHTHLMAEAIAAGVQKNLDVKVQLLRITGEQIVNGRWQDEVMVASLNSAEVMGQAVPDFSGTKAVELDAGDRLSCELYGQRIANAVDRWNK
jgi:NAD(P)H dehydrogenase (quinone)